VAAPSLSRFLRQGGDFDFHRVGHSREVKIPTLPRRTLDAPPAEVFGGWATVLLHATGVTREQLDAHRFPFQNKSGTSSPAISYTRDSCGSTSKCTSRANRTSECCKTSAAIHMSFVGIGVPCLRNCRYTVA